MKEIKTVKALIQTLEAISNIDRDKLKGIKNDKQYLIIGDVRAYVQEGLTELRDSDDINSSSLDIYLNLIESASEPLVGTNTLVGDISNMPITEQLNKEEKK